jgi:DnaJ-class molecular chaperone
MVGASSRRARACSPCRSRVRAAAGTARSSRSRARSAGARAANGARIRLKGKGEIGEGGGPAGDLYVVTRVEPSKKFERRGADLVIEVPVTYTEAALGATVEVPTPYGDRVSLKVPAGTQDGRQLRIRGHGAPKLDGSGKGDLIARLRVSVPKKLSKKEREALEELQKLSHDDPREALFS